MLHIHSLKQNKQKTVVHENILDEAVRILILINLNPQVDVFLILCVAKWESTHKAPQSAYLKENAFSFSCNVTFTNKLRLFELQYLAEIFSKMNKVGLLFQNKQLSIRHQ